MVECMYIECMLLDGCQYVVTSINSQLSGNFFISRKLTVEANMALLLSCSALLATYLLWRNFCKQT